nr:MptD family putative ECF transporter S component [uncultured Selenomonas sp.]
MNAWKTSDFVLIGILSALYGVLVLGIGALTVLLSPAMHALSPALIGVLLGTVFLFVVKKIPKFGAITLFAAISTALFAGFSGMMYVPFVGSVTAVALAVDLAVRALGQRIPVLAAGYGLIQASYVFGGAIPMLFFLEQNIQRWQEMGMDMQTIQHFVEHSTGVFLAAGMGIAFMGGFIGVYIGKRILKKHFKELS